MKKNRLSGRKAALRKAKENKEKSFCVSTEYYKIRQTCFALLWRKMKNFRKNWSLFGKQKNEFSRLLRKFAIALHSI